MRAIVATFVILYVPSFLFTFVFLNLRSVEVGGDLSVKVDRVIQQDYPGTFEVEVRRASDHRHICSGGPKTKLINYSARASEKNPIHMRFDEWVGLHTPWDIATCLGRGLNAGEAFYLTTCHKAFGPLEVVIARRCVKSNEFTPTAEAIESLRTTFKHQ